MPVLERILIILVMVVLQFIPGISLLLSRSVPNSTTRASRQFLKSKSLTCPVQVRRQIASHERSQWCHHRPLNHGRTTTPTGWSVPYRLSASRTRLFSTAQETSVILDGLNPSQVDAVTQSTEAITRVIAGPGSGKTRVLISRVAYLLEVDPRARVLAVTFTRKASGEMQQRVEDLLRRKQEEEEAGDSALVEPPASTGQIVEENLSNAPKGLERVTLGTFHSICAKVLRYNGELLASLPSVESDMVGRPAESSVNLDGSFAILDQSDQLRLIKECLDESKIDLKETATKPLTILTAIGQIKEAKSQGKDLMQNNDNRKPIPKSMKIAKEIYSLYREKVLSNNALDFDDLIYMTRELLLVNSDLQERLHRRWPHILVDEFQDTSKTQMDLVRLLTSKSLLVVGDADQSIYSWRGAHAGSLSDFKTEFSEYVDEGVSTVYLKENYRSTSNIVNAAEKVISISGKGSKGKQDELRRAMKPKRGSGPSPRVVACANEKAEAKFVVDTVFELLNDASIGSDTSVAIIYRTNAQSRYLEEACVKNNLPYVIRGGAGGFYKRAEVKDCLCFLRWLHNGNDESAMLRAMKTPSKGLGDKALLEFKSYFGLVEDFYRQHLPGAKRPTRLDVMIALTDSESDVVSLAEGAPSAADHISKRALNNFLPFSRQMRVIRDKAFKIPLDALLFFIIDELELFQHFDAISKSKSEFADRRENVQELRGATKKYASYGPALATLETDDPMEDSFDTETALGSFLDDVALVSDIKNEDSGSDDGRLVVSLMTIHASKGMEFDLVFVVGNEEGTLPSGLSLQEGEGSIALEEEKRLCYVAMTRAKTRLILTWRKEVTSFAGLLSTGSKTSTKERSRFLDALVAKKGKAPTSSHGKVNGSGDGDDLLRRQRDLQISDSRLQTRPAAALATNPRPRQAEGNAVRKASSVPLRPTQRGASSRLAGETRLSRIQNERTMVDKARAKPAVRQPANPLRTVAPGERVSSAPRANIEQAQPPKSSKPPTTTSQQSFDSTLFYPVGSGVVHNNFGRGEVLEPPPAKRDGKLLVRVKFENGRTMEFPVEGPDLSPEF